MPEWLTYLAIISLLVAAGSALIILIDIVAGHPQHMGIMNAVWPLTALYGGPLAVWFYYRVGRLSTHQAMREAKEHGEKPLAKQKPYWESVAVAATHCGSGCTLGDIVAETFLIFVPLTLFGMRIFAGWAVDYAAAFLIGIAFQYFTIKPMKHLSAGKGVIEALKADALSLTAWQVGMYGWMAIATFLIFGQELNKTGPVFWFMMQIAMLAGFLTAFPVNWWLIRTGIKEKM